MKSVKNLVDLENEIAILRQRQKLDLASLQYQYQVTRHNLKPTNLFKSAFKEAVAAPNLKTNVLKAAVGFGTTYLSKRLFDTNSGGPVKRILGHAVKFGISYFSLNKLKQVLV